MVNLYVHFIVIIFCYTQFCLISNTIFTFNQVTFNKIQMTFQKKKEFKW